MSITTESLYELLPSLYRLQDAKQGEQLKVLISILAEQAALVEENLEQLYDDQFIETCAEWVTPYIGDLVGYRALHVVASKVSSPRADVANTIRYRRRKGTATMLEQVARDVTGWDSRVVEMFQRLVTTQYMNHIRPENNFSPNLRKWEPLENLNTPFDSMNHMIDVGRISTKEGKYNIPNIAIFLWRLQAFPLTKVQAYKVDSKRYLFNPLGIDTPLFSHPLSEDEITHLAEKKNVPAPISRRVLNQDIDPVDPVNSGEKTYYGVGKSIQVYKKENNIYKKLAAHVCNLSDMPNGNGNWANLPAKHPVAIDPVLGRIALNDSVEEVYVDYYYGFSSEMGGGEYERAHTFSNDIEPELYVESAEFIQKKLDEAMSGGVVEIKDNNTYEEKLAINITETAKSIEIRSANNRRPVIKLTEDLVIKGESDCEVILNGLVITGGRIKVLKSGNNRLSKLTLRHCTLVPGISLLRSGEPEKDGVPSLDINLENIDVVIEHCITGAIRTSKGARINISDSIVDATSSDKVALAGDQSGTKEAGELTLLDCTIIGRVNVRSMALVSNSILHAVKSETQPPVRAEIKQVGCVRFSYVPPGSRVPSPYRCQPVLAVRQELAKTENNEPLLPGQKNILTESIQGRIKPSFTSLRYGDAGYCQLGQLCPKEIKKGAEDESEMGVFHKLYQAHRETNLKVRLDEYLRYGLEAGIFYVT